MDVHLDPEDQQVGSDLGWGEGVPEAEVVIRRLSSTFADTALTSSSGRAEFADLLEGNYEVSVVRILDSAERALLPEERSDVLALGGARVYSVRPPSRSVELTTAAGRTGSLVISEHYVPGILDDSGTSYDVNNFLEIYNASDTTIYLDGKLVGAGWDRSLMAGDYPCTLYDHLRHDPEGIWARFIYRFPGDGRRYPLVPGRVAVLATDAIDHGQFIEEGLDLSRADFEFLGTQDVDNPAVPNLEPVGPSIDILGHGRIFSVVAGVPFIAESLDLESLPRISPDLPPTNPEHVRIPREAVLDVAHFIWRGGTIPVCQSLVHPDFDRGVAAAIPEPTTLSLQRRRLLTLPDGRVLLQRTRTSSRDFEQAVVTPGEIP